MTSAPAADAPLPRGMLLLRDIDTASAPRRTVYWVLCDGDTFRDRLGSGATGTCAQVSCRACHAVGCSDNPVYVDVQHSISGELCARCVAHALRTAVCTVPSSTATTLYSLPAIMAAAEK